MATLTASELPSTLRLRAAWAAFLDGCFANWSYRKGGFAFLVPDTKLWDINGRASYTDLTIVILDAPVSDHAALSERYADEGAVLALGGLPHGPDRLAGLTYGLGGDGKVALVESRSRSFVIPGLDEDECFALFDDDHRALAHMNIPATREAFDDAHEEFLCPTHPSCALSDSELAAVDEVARNGFAPLTGGGRFDDALLAPAGLTVADHGGGLALMVSDRERFMMFLGLMDDLLFEDISQKNYDMAALGLVRVASTTSDGKLECFYRPGTTSGMRSRWAAAVEAYRAAGDGMRTDAWGLKEGGNA